MVSDEAKEICFQFEQAANGKIYPDELEKAVERILECVRLEARLEQHVQGCLLCQAAREQRLTYVCFEAIDMQRQLAAAKEPAK